MHVDARGYVSPWAVQILSTRVYVSSKFGESRFMIISPLHIVFPQESPNNDSSTGSKGSANSGKKTLPAVKKAFKVECNKILLIPLSCARSLKCTFLSQIMNISKPLGVGVRSPHVKTYIVLRI